VTVVDTRLIIYNERKGWHNERKGGHSGTYRHRHREHRGHIGVHNVQNNPFLCLQGWGLNYEIERHNV